MAHEMILPSTRYEPPARNATKRRDSAISTERFISNSPAVSWSSVDPDSDYFSESESAPSSVLVDETEQDSDKYDPEADRTPLSLLGTRPCKLRQDSYNYESESESPSPLLVVYPLRKRTHSAIAALEDGSNDDFSDITSFLGALVAEEQREVEGLMTGGPAPAIGVLSDGPNDDFSNITSFLGALIAGEEHKVESFAAEYSFDADNDLSDMTQWIPIFLDDPSLQDEDLELVWMRPSGLGMDTSLLDKYRGGRQPSSRTRLDILERIREAWAAQHYLTGDSDVGSVADEYLVEPESYEELLQMIQSWNTGLEPREEILPHPILDGESLRGMVMSAMSQAKEDHMRYRMEKERIKGRIQTAMQMKHREELMRLEQEKRLTNWKWALAVKDDVLAEMQADHKERENILSEELTELISPYTALCATFSQLNRIPFSELFRRCEGADISLRTALRLDQSLVDNFYRDIEVSVDGMTRLMVHLAYLLDDSESLESSDSETSETSTLKIVSNVSQAMDVLQHKSKIILKQLDDIQFSNGLLLDFAEKKAQIYNEAYAAI